MSDVPDKPKLSSDHLDLTGQTVGDYQLLRRLGSGGMATVYLAQQQSLHRRVAFKVLNPELAKDPTYVQRFQNEARAAAALVQANIVQIYEVGCVDGCHFIAQEYVPGKNLAQLLSQKGALDVDLTVNIMRQVGAALMKAGGQGIIHRDIKPENIMLTPNGEVKVADFGLARVTGEGQPLNVTQAGMTMGTPLYMSPEQVEASQVDPRSDLYSLGVTCYHMLVGRPPFQGETALAVAIQHAKSEPESLDNLRPDLPAGLSDLVHKLLRKNPAERFANAAEMLRALRELNIVSDQSGWPSGLEQWSEEERSLLQQPHLQATQKLDVLMKTTSMAESARHRRRWLMPCVLMAALVVGSVVGWFTRPAPLLAPIEGAPSNVQRRPTVAEQYQFAYWTRTEAAWKAVEGYFPASKATDAAEEQTRELYARRAKEKLAELYVDEGDLQSAMEQFTELANLSETDVEFRLFGIAGQALVFAEQGDREQAVAKLAEVYPQRNRLRPTMRRRIEQLSVKLGRSR